MTEAVGPFESPRFRGEIVARHRPTGDAASEIERVLAPEAARRTLHWGRNILYTATLAAAAGPLPVVVKHFRESGWTARWRRLLRGSKARRSWEMARALTAAGLPTAQPVLVAEARRPRGADYFVSGDLGDVLELRYPLRAANAGRLAEEFPGLDLGAVLEDLGRLLWRLHEAGFWHRDLSIGNVLLRQVGPSSGPPELFLVDLNRARRLGRLGVSRRTRDLCRLALFRPADRRRLVEAYWAPRRRGLPVKWFLYLVYHHGFHARVAAKRRLRSALGGVAGWLATRGAHAHIPEAPPGAAARERAVWDPLSDQPHQHAGRLVRLGVRLADAAAHGESLAALLRATPPAWRRYRRLRRELYRRPASWPEPGVALRPWPEAPDLPLLLLEEAGIRHVLLRLHLWEPDRRPELELAAELHGRGFEVSFALAQSRELVCDPPRWRAVVEEVAEAFTPFGRRFQIGQAINRSKWGVWNYREYWRLADAAAEVLKTRPGVETLGPAVIDFEPHAAAAVLAMRRARSRFDIASSLLYVDRRGAPETPQLGFDTARKVALMKAIADTARNCGPRLWITETNWPLREGPHAPAGRAVAVDEETQADYLARYFLITQATGLVERVFWWQLLARGYGLLDPSTGGAPRRRPAFQALATLARTLRGSTFLDALPAPPGTRLLRFRAADRGELVVGWSHDRRTVAHLPRPSVEATGRDGETLAAPGTEVRLGPSPLYLRLAD